MPAPALRGGHGQSGSGHGCARFTQGCPIGFARPEGEGVHWGASGSPRRLSGTTRHSGLLPPGARCVAIAMPTITFGGWPSLVSSSCLVMSLRRLWNCGISFLIVSLATAIGEIYSLHVGPSCAVRAPRPASPARRFGFEPPHRTQRADRGATVSVLALPFRQDGVRPFCSAVTCREIN
jgi:hypothetical protein